MKHTHLKAPLFSLLALTATSQAQTTHTWVSDGTGGTNKSWTTAAHWDTAPLIPGAVTTDIVNISNVRAGAGNEIVRINNVDVGTVDQLNIGGNAQVAVQVRGDDGNIRINTLTLGAGGQAGQFLVNNLGSSATVGSIVSGSTNGSNRIIVGANVAGGLTLNGDIDSTGTREIDLRIGANANSVPSRFVLGTGNQLLSVDDFMVGQQWNGNANNASYTLSGGNNIEANLVRVGSLDGNTGNSADRSASNVSLTVDGGSSISSLGTTETNANFHIAFANAAYINNQTIDGTLNVEDATIDVDNVLSLGLSNLNTVTIGSTHTVDGEMNLNHANSLVNVGRISGSGSNVDKIQGGLNIGEDRTANATVNVNNGTLNSIARLYLGGDATDGQDVSTTGTLNIGPNGTVRLGNVLPTDNNHAGVARDSSVILGAANLEVGRDGTGILDIDGGTLDIVRGNLVLGQTGTDTKDEYNQAGGSGSNSSNGTVTFRNGATVNIGRVQGSAGEHNSAELKNSLNINNGTGTITQSGAATTVTIEDNLNLGNGGGNSIYKMQDGTLNVGNNINANGGAGTDLLEISGGDINVTNNLNMNGGTDSIFKLNGSAATINVEGNFNVSTSTAMNLTLDSGGISTIAVGGTHVYINTGILTVNAGTLSSANTLGDLTLVNTTDPAAVISGSFANFANGNQVVFFGDGSAYFLKTDGGDGNDIQLIAGASLGPTDNDMDGIADAYETANGLNVGIDDSATDPDNDGMTALDEYLFGTLENDSSSVFTIEITQVSGTTVDVSYGPVAAGRTYILQGSADLINFNDVDTFSSTAAAINQAVAHTSSIDPGFYRVKASLTP